MVSIAARAGNSSFRNRMGLLSTKVLASDCRKQLCEGSNSRSAFAADPECRRRLGLFPRKTIVAGADVLRRAGAQRRSGGGSSLEPAEILAESGRRLASGGGSSGAELGNVAVCGDGAISR